MTVHMVRAGHGEQEEETGLGDKGMPQQPVNKKSIKDYLLGASSEPETERLDEMSLTDDEFADQLRAVENDLVDAYVKGELTGDALARFNSHYLASPRRREKVRFAQAFVGVSETRGAARSEETRAIAPAGPAAGTRGLGFFGLPRPALQWGLAAAAMLLLLASGYLIIENVRLRNLMTQAQAERASLERREQELLDQLENERALDAKTAEDLARVRDRLAQLETESGADRRDGDRDQKVVAYNLAPPTRGVSQIPVIAVPEGTDQVTLTLELEAQDFSTYEAALKDPATGQQILRIPRLKANNNKSSVRISLPARILKTQNYLLELTGISAGGPEKIGSYSFRIVRQ